MLLALAVLNGVVASCSAFAGSPDEQPLVVPLEAGPTADASATPDGEADAVDAETTDIPCPEAGLSADGLFCEDFNQAPAPPTWRFVALPPDTGGSVELFSDLSAPSGPNSLRATFRSDGGGRSAGIYYDAPDNHGSVSCSVMINPTVPGAVDLELAALFLEQGGRTRRFLSVHTNQGGTISASVEDLLDDGGLSNPVEGTPVPLVADWRQLRFALVGTNATVAYDGMTILDSRRDSLVVEKAQMALLLGSAGGPVALSSVRYDNVRCSIMP